MLILDRKLGEKIIIDLGDRKVEIMLVDIDRGKCRLGFSAPREIEIYRTELLTRGKDAKPLDT